MNDNSRTRPVVTNKPYSVPIEMRPLWRISLLIAAIATVGGDKGYLSVKKVNLLVWMLIRRKRWSEYESFLHGRSMNIPLISTDTATYKAIEFALAKSLIRLDSSRLFITEAGLVLYRLLIENDIMRNEILFLGEVGKKLTDKKVKAITEGLI